MEIETTKYQGEDAEDGECTDSDGSYTPLQRPERKAPEQGDASAKPTMDNDVDDSLSDISQSSESSSGSDQGLKAATRTAKQPKKKKIKKVIVAPPSNDTQERFKKYNIWSASLQEDTLMENMRGIGVATNPGSDRNVEAYDFSLKYRLEKTTNSLKRRLSNSENDSSDSAYNHKNKRIRSSGSSKRMPVKSRTGRRESTSSCDSQNAPRYILDLNIDPASDVDDIAREIANKLYEEKDDLLLRVVSVLGKDLPIEVFKETQRIEKDGGMMIMNGMRRRTPGGVFLFLLKHHDNISPGDKKLIFHEEVKKSSKDRKVLQATKRDQKVEELKKRLEKEKELAPLSASRAEAMCTLKHENHATLSNPPPSPVANSGQDNSPEYSIHAINHVNDASPEKAASAKDANDLDDDNLITYNDDFLDMNCEDMDMF